MSLSLVPLLQADIFFLFSFLFLSGCSFSVQDRGSPGCGGEVQWEVSDLECKGAGLSAQEKHQEQCWVFLIGKLLTGLLWNRLFFGSWTCSSAVGSGRCSVFRREFRWTTREWCRCFYWVFSACSGSFCPWPRARPAWWSMTSWTSCPSPATLPTSLLFPLGPRSVRHPSPLPWQKFLSWPWGVKDLKTGNVFISSWFISEDGIAERKQNILQKLCGWGLGSCFFYTLLFF